MNKISRKDARALGLKKYFTGRLCSRGHLAERHTCNAVCILCAKENGKKYNNENSEMISAYRKDHYRKNKQYYAEYRENWRSNNQERKRKSDTEYRKANPQVHRKSILKWANKNRPKVNSIAAKRRAAKQNATPSWANLDDILSFYEEAARLTAETGIEHHVDHIIPLQSENVCGLHIPWNLQVLPAIDNISKGNRRWPDMWRVAQ